MTTVLSACGGRIGEDLKHHAQLVADETHSGVIGARPLPQIAVAVRGSTLVGELLILCGPDEDKKGHCWMAVDKATGKVVWQAIPAMPSPPSTTMPGPSAVSVTVPDNRGRYLLMEPISVSGQ